jgi:hypothetical protein
MRITKRQLRRIIKEYGGRPYDPTIPGDFERARDNPTGDAPPGNNPEWDDEEGDDDWRWEPEQRQYQEYEKWARESGHITPGASSVIATYFVEQGLTDDKEHIDTIAAGYRIDLQDVMREIEFQQKEYEAGGVLSDEEDYERGFHEGVSPDNMPDAWRQILGDCLGKTK